MTLFSMLSSPRALVGLDVGLSTLKLIELDRTRSALTALAVAPTPQDLFKAGAVVNPAALGAALAELFDENQISNRAVALAMPGSSTFSKQLRIPLKPLSQLAASIRAEAVNFIPEDVDAVKLDFHIIGEAGDSQVDVLVVAVREEVLESYRAATVAAGLDLQVVDVDFFALQNCFEFSYPEAAAETVGLIDVGSSVSSINICRRGSSIFTGDISVGVGSLLDAVRSTLGVSRQEAREIACRGVAPGGDGAAAGEIIDARLDKIALECGRQLNFFWKAAGADGDIDRILFSGGGACVKGIAERVAERTGIPAEILDPFRDLALPDQLDPAELRERGPLLGVAMGLALRSPGDRIVPESVASLESKRLW